MKHIKRIFALTLALCLALSLAVFADSPTDEILDYEIHAQVLEDAKVHFTYHLQWKVLESDKLGPVEWVTVGVPNSNIEEITAETENIKDIAYEYSGNDIRIDFGQKYYKDEVIDFTFSFIQDEIYQINGREEGKTLYQFTPGWFNGIAVDHLAIYWSNDKVDSFSPAALVLGDEICWETSLAAGGHLSIEVVYPNDAYAFKEAVASSGDSYGGGDYYYQEPGFGFSSIFGIQSAFIPLAILGVVISTIKKAYEQGSGFGGATKAKVTRTKVVYYDVCPSCGAPRTEGKDDCEYCGHTLIKSEEIIKEEELDDEAKKFNTDGMYHYGTNPNTFVRVHVVPVVVPHTTTHHMGGGGGRHGGGCACACVSSCACACACACAGGGRAGCTNKDFYKTGLKLKQLELKKKK